MCVTNRAIPDSEARAEGLGKCDVLDHDNLSVALFSHILYRREV